MRIHGPEVPSIKMIPPLISRDIHGITDPMLGESANYSLLVVDDEISVIRSLKRVFYDTDFVIRGAENAQEALACLAVTRVDLAILDLKMPGMDGMALLEEIKRRHPRTHIIMLTGHGGVQEAVAAIQKGASDFLEKPFSPEGLRARVAQLHQIWCLERENRRLREQAAFRFGFDRLVGNSEAISKLKETIVQVGASDVPVLIEGETGTGKELVARAIHHHSTRSKEIFVPVDCAAISETVIESELFGHVKGAFTGAHVATLGLIRSADKGTLFLDEVGELPLSLQAKLLRTIQEREVRPVGGTRSHPVDIRILAATNRNLEEEVRSSRFREDLYYRLNVVKVESPPLRKRGGDIPLLTRYFIERFSSSGLSVKDISEKSLVCLENYGWPGNVRELENVIRRAAALGRGVSISPCDLPAEIQACGDSAHAGHDQETCTTLAEYECRAIRNALEASGGNRKKAASLLDIGEATLYRKLKKYRIAG